MTRTTPPLILITRPEPGASALAEALQDTGVEIVVSPVTGILPVEAPALPERFDGLILTSANAVDAARRMAPPGTSAWCVGEGTARAATEAGFMTRSGPGDAAALIDLIAAEAPGARLAHLRGAEIAVDVAAALEERGVMVISRIVYRQTDLPLSDAARMALSGVRPVVLPVFSVRSADRLRGIVGDLAPRHVVAISPAVAEAASRCLAPTSLTTADRPDLAAMIAATTRVVGSF